MKIPIDPPLKYHDETLDIKVAWLKFAEETTAKIDQMEKEAEKNYGKLMANGSPYDERKKLATKIQWCERQKTKLHQAKERKFELSAIDYETINEHGFEYWFKVFDDYLGSKLETNAK